jgi:hypothetical protein
MYYCPHLSLRQRIVGYINLQNIFFTTNNCLLMFIIKLFVQLKEFLVERGQIVDMLQ